MAVIKDLCIGCCGYFELWVFQCVVEEDICIASLDDCFG